MTQTFHARTCRQAQQRLQGLPDHGLQSAAVLRIRRNFQTHGAEGLIDRLPAAKGPHPNRVSAKVGQAILDHSLERPSHGGVRGWA